MAKSKIDNSFGPESYQRDENGLLKNIQYVFNEDGSIDWRKMVNDEHLFPNAQAFNGNPPTSIEGIPDNKLLIKLAGIKELARLRGFSDVSYEVVKCELDHVAVICRMTFIPNYETNNEPITFEDMANATLDNTHDFGQNFLETMACNRSFVRAVRNFLNIHIVGADEIGKTNNSSAKKSSMPGKSPQAMLSTAYDSDFQNFIADLRKLWAKDLYKNEEAGKWQQFDDIPIKEARILIKLIKQI
jgi:hypothetical protein|tara:strand:+ start:45578 stop:46309 length:732 start_codon:yes stop_codon:yes gene_type:complete